MRKIGAEVAAGVAIILALIVFVFGFLTLKSITMKAGNYEVFIHFDDVTGLEKSDFISVSGLRVGKVENFELQNKGVMVTARLEPIVELPRDSHAEIKTLGMVGEKFIDIIPGSSTEILQDGDQIEGSAESDIMAIAGSADQVIDQVSEILTEVKDLFDAENKRNLKEALRHANSLATTLDNNTRHITRALARLDTITTTLNELVAERRGKVETSIDNFHTASSQLDSLTQKVDKSLTTVQTLLDKIENQEGTVGKLVSSDEMYNDIRNLTAELDGLVKDLKKRPQRYINLGFIKVF